MRHSRNWLLFYDGKFYDTKPIVESAFIRAVGDDDSELYDWGFWGGIGYRNTAAQLLLNLGFNVVSLVDKKGIEREKKADEEAKKIERDPKRDVTTKRQLIEARVGQGKYRNNLIQIEGCCRVTGVKDPAYLRASHIKPWCESKDDERLDGNNGLLLAPHIDHLFDRGYISFTDSGRLMVADDVSGNEDLSEVLKMWHINRRKNYGAFNKAQRRYLAYHRDKIYRGAIRKDQGV